MCFILFNSHIYKECLYIPYKKLKRNISLFVCLFNSTFSHGIWAVIDRKMVQSESKNYKKFLRLLGCYSKHFELFFLFSFGCCIPFEKKCLSETARYVYGICQLTRKVKVRISEYFHSKLFELEWPRMWRITKVS